MPTLPLQIKNYNHILVRIVRIIGGICLTLSVTKLYLTFPEIIRYLILFISILKVKIIQILIILIIKIIYRYL